MIIKYVLLVGSYPATQQHGFMHRDGEKLGLSWVLFFFVLFSFDLLYFNPKCVMKKTEKD